MTTKYRISIVIASYNEGCELKKTVDSILNNAGTDDYELIVVDDCSDDGSADFVETDEYQSVVLIRNDKRLGAVKSRNLGFEKTSGDIIAFFDAHMNFPNNFLVKISSVFEQNSEVDILGTTCYDRDKPQNRHNYSSVYTNSDMSFVSATFINGLRFKKLTEVPFVNCGNFIIKRDVFLSLGGFDDGMILWGPEDRDLSIRAWLCGYRLFIEPNIEIGHLYRVGKKKSEELKAIRKKGIVYNSLRIGYKYFSDDRLSRMIYYLEKYPDYKKDLKKIKNDKVFNKENEELRKKFKYSDDEFFTRFEPLMPFVTADYFWQAMEKYKTRQFDDAVELFMKFFKLKYSFGYVNKYSYKAIACNKMAKIKLFYSSYFGAAKYFFKSYLYNILAFFIK